MTKRGYPAERLASFNGFLDALTFLDAAHEAAAEAAAPRRGNHRPARRRGSHRQNGP